MPGEVAGGIAQASEFVFCRGAAGRHREDARDVPEGEAMNTGQETSSAIVACGGYRCGCVMLAADFAGVPVVCPTHGAGQLGPVAWERNPHNVSLGLSAAQEYRP